MSEIKVRAGSEEVEIEPLQLNSQERSQVNSDAKGEFGRILDKLETKVQKPLQDLREVIEAEIVRLSSKE